MDKHTPLKNNEEQKKEPSPQKRQYSRRITENIGKSKSLIIPDENKNWTRHLQDNEIYLDMIGQTAKN
jgi:hypothetical protein